MQILSNGDKNILKLLASQGREASIYRPSAYLLSLELRDELLVLNTLTGECLLLPPEQKALFCKLPMEYCPELSEFLQHHMIVREGTDEARTVEQLRTLLRKYDADRSVINHYNILPTTGCNARCFYCYESSIEHLHMSEATAEQLIRYIAAHHGGQKVILSWFGGEPTLGEKRITQICSGLRELGIEYDSDMVSNAYLFDERLVSVAKDNWNLNRIQVTLDGTEEVYIRTKSYVGITDNPYQRVLRNIGLLLHEGIEVHIRLNFDRHNAENLKNLMEELSVRFKGEKSLYVYIRQLYEGVGYAPVCHTSDERNVLDRQYKELQAYLDNKGWHQRRKPSFPKLSLFSCMADNPHCIQCTPDGILSICEDKIFESAVGSLDQGIVSKDVLSWWKERTITEDCGSCPLYPSCKDLLKHCPVRKETCDENKKSRTIAHYYQMMREKYDERF